ncbi:MAG: type IV pilus secretin PilQ [Desulfovibrionales bacterium]
MNISEDVDIAPEYADTTLKLHFTPSVSEVDPSSVQPEGAVLGVRAVSGPVVGSMQSLILELEDDSQFLLSRPEEGVLKVLLVPKDGQEEETAPQKKGYLLSGFDFSKDKDGWFYVHIRAEEGLDYYPRPGREGQIRLIFPELQVPDEYAKLYRLHKFDLGMKTAQLKNSTEGAEMVLTMGSRRPMHVEKKSGELVFKILGVPGDLVVQKNPESPQKKNPAAPVENPGEDQFLEEFNTLFPGMRTNYTGEPISINLQDADVEHVLRLISEVSGYNLILDEDVSGLISLKLENVPWDQALDLVLLQKDLGMVLRGNIIRIATKAKLQNEQADMRRAREAALEAQDAYRNLAPLETEFIQINYSTAAELLPQIQDFIGERGSATFDQRTNMIIVTATEPQLETVRSVVEKLDRPEKQVLIEARVVYATDDFQRAIGIKWGGGFANIDDQHLHQTYGAGTPGLTNLEPYETTDTTVDIETPSNYAVNLPAQFVTGGIGYTLAKFVGENQFVLDTQLQLAEENSLTKVISSPRLVTLNNQRAEIVQGTMIATPTESESGGTTIEYQEAVLELSVLPQITPDNKLILAVEVSDDAPDGDDISTRSVQTKLIIEDGEIIVIGGVNKVTQDNTRGRVPGLYRVPLLGWIFKNKFIQDNNEELLIFIRAKVL